MANISMHTFYFIFLLFMYSIPGVQYSTVQYSRTVAVSAELQAQSNHEMLSVR